ncbi:SIS domain-containing protein [uncultured Jatrophihabitans sp.]|uniref:SIS domain-containing protein n=1 Tax=uncultured Jatrophihabitans sp. TaxID=1610747 RepID=UPI0035CACB81
MSTDTTDLRQSADGATAPPGRPFVAAEIDRQPESWRAAAKLVGREAAVLPRPGARVAAIGCGTSWFMAQAYAAIRESAGLGLTDAFAASDFPADRDYDVVVAISRSGTTTEVIRAIDGISSPVVGITAVAGTPVVGVADEAIVLDFADEQSVVQTVFATTALALLRASLGEDVDALAEQASAVLDGANPVPAEAVDVDQITFLGQGGAFGIAQEAALKMREAARLWTESYPQMEYRHGPIAVAQPGRAVWLFGAPVPGIVADVARTGAMLVEDDLDPMVDLVRAHRLAVVRARRRGLDPDHPRSLTRSVVLDVRD